MASVADIGNGIGYLYITNPSGSIIFNLPNDDKSVNIAKSICSEGSNFAGNRSAIGLLDITVAPSGNGSVTAVNVAGVNQIGASVAYTGATTVSDLATALATAINSHTAVSGEDYSAVAVAGKVYIIAPSSAGSGVNGATVAASVGANPPTIVATDMGGGTDAAGVYDNADGFRVYIDANYSGTAVPGNKTSAVEITSFIVKRGLESSILSQSVGIVSGGITINRTGNVMHIPVKNEGKAGTDDLDTIIPLDDFVLGDIVVLRGDDPTQIVTITSAGNINTLSPWSSSTSANAIGLRYAGGEWHEIFRSVDMDTESFRDAGIPVLDASFYGKSTTTAADNTTRTITLQGNSKNFVEITGSATLSSGDFNVNISNTGAIPGDLVYMFYNAQVTVGAYDVEINGLAIDPDIALTGGMYYIWEFDGTKWEILSRSADILGNAKVITTMLKDDAVTVAKIENNLTYELITLEVSFETGEIGDFKIKMPFPGTVTEIYAYATKAIAATDNGTIVPKDNGGVTMTAGTITYTASDARGTAYTSTPSANNTFAAGDLLTFTTAKATAGGKVQLSIKVTRS